jgi:carboxymethylenebutenolidase
MNEPRQSILTPAQQALSDLWDEHLQHEFATRDPAQTIDTMVADAYVNHVPVLTGGSGRSELSAFYSQYFIPQMPPDMEIVPVSRTIGHNRLVDESVARFSHTVRMDWLLPGVAPTGKRVEVALVVVVEFRDSKLLGERIYWDQASVLVQLGLLDPVTLPIAGVESARKVLDPTIPSNELIKRATQGV